MRGFIAGPQVDALVLRLCEVACAISLPMGLATATLVDMFLHLRLGCDISPLQPVSGKTQVLAGVSSAGLQNQGTLNCPVRPNLLLKGYLPQLHRIRTVAVRPSSLLNGVLRDGSRCDLYDALRQPNGRSPRRVQRGRAVTSMVASRHQLSGSVRLQERRLRRAAAPRTPGASSRVLPYRSRSGRAICKPGWACGSLSQRQEVAPLGCSGLQPKPQHWKVHRPDVLQTLLQFDSEVSSTPADPVVLGPLDDSGLSRKSPARSRPCSRCSRSCPDCLARGVQLNGFVGQVSPRDSRASLIVSGVSASG